MGNIDVDHQQLDSDVLAKIVVTAILQCALHGGSDPLVPRRATILSHERNTSRHAVSVQTHIDIVATIVLLQFAVEQLRELSDSGIYQTLSLAKIHAAATELGDFHYVIHLEVALSSPYFRSKEDVEDFEMMVLESKPRVEERAGGKYNATRSIAIDEFPEMDEDAIESFWMQMVEDRKRRRRELFEKWEREGEAVTEQQIDAEVVQHGSGHPERQAVKASADKVTKTLTIDELRAMPAKHLRQLLTTPESTEALRAAISVILDERLTLLEQHEDAALAQNNQPQPTQLHYRRDEL
ncbi:unnamed protein product [Phytophthora fragariaefolia]|uniref:Unnamed protein product n=1 Tax=Phytophthora fragariaefolia TaxID=1490495 RepID=A0A9W6UCH2_9STRA|nr:unnamed protein product [Phytophthora fragariaefolia]